MQVCTNDPVLTSFYIAAPIINQTSQRETGQTVSILKHVVVAIHLKNYMQGSTFEMWNYFMKIGGTILHSIDDTEVINQWDIIDILQKYPLQL